MVPLNARERCLWWCGKAAGEYRLVLGPPRLAQRAVFTGTLRTIIADLSRDVSSNWFRFALPAPALRGAAIALRRLLSPLCIVCGVTPGHPCGSPVCDGCTADYFPLGTRRCRLCANRLPAPHYRDGAADCPGAAAAAELCGRCLSHPPRFDGTLALADYAPPVDAMIAALKFHGRLDLGLAFGALLAGRARHLPADAVVALPLASQRLRERGYNQAEEIARAVAAGLQRPLLRRALLRTGHGARQQDLRLAQRRSNVRGAFAAGADVAGRDLLLVDDVLTTGSTLDAAADALKRGGARTVLALVVARTP